MKSRVEILSELSELLVEMFELEISDINLEANLYEDLDIDSIDAVDLMVRLKEWTGEKVSPEDFKNVRTVNDVVSAIEELLNRAA
jgi:acyl carrier protein